MAMKAVSCTLSKHAALTVCGAELLQVMIGRSRQQICEGLVYAVHQGLV